MVKTKPVYITIEDLNAKGMMKNRHLSKAVASQKFYDFREKLEAKCKEKRIELRIADRIYICKCGYKAEQDYNASLNLKDAETYKTA